MPYPVVSDLVTGPPEPVLRRPSERRGSIVRPLITVITHGPGCDSWFLSPHPFNAPSQRILNLASMRCCSSEGASVRRNRILVESTCLR